MKTPSPENVIDFDSELGEESIAKDFALDLAKVATTAYRLGANSS